MFHKLVDSLTPRQAFWTRPLTIVVLAASLAPSLAGSLVVPAQAASAAVSFHSSSATHLIAVQPMSGCQSVDTPC